MRKLCSRTYLGVAAQPQASRTWRLSSETGSTQCRARDAYRRITERGHLHRQSASRGVGFAGSHYQKPAPQGVPHETEGAAPPQP
jgi:hypothetical protein